MRIHHLCHLNSERPAVALPPELLSEIFLFACARQHDTRDRRRFLHGEISRRDRYNITRTCHAWRETAIAATALWCCISIVVGDPVDYEDDDSEDDSDEGSDEVSTDDLEIEPEDFRLVQPKFHTLQLDLKRAGDRPLMILIRAVGALPDHWGVEAAALRAALPRSRFLCIVDLEDADLLSALITEQPIAFPLLKTFIVDSLYPNIAIDLSLAPQLKSARSYGAPFLTNLVPRNIIRLSDNRTNLRLLQRCKRLQWLSLTITRRWTQRLQGQAVPEIRLSNLRRLSISWVGDSEILQTVGDHILSAITAPKLRYLQLRSARIPSVRGQYPSLHSLDLQTRRGDMPHSVADLEALFAHFPTIGELLMPDQKLEYLEDILIARDEHGEFKWLPNLSDLWLETADETTAKKLIAVRNGGLNEERGMPFRLNLKRCTAELQTSHTWSVKVQPYVDPFDIVNGSIPVARFGAARSRRPFPTAQTDT